MIKKVLSKLFLKPVYASRTISEDPLQKFHFRVTLPGFPPMGFQKCTGLTYEASSTTYDEGGYDHTHKMPGRLQVGDVTLERGTYADSSFQTLIREALTQETMRHTVIIEHMDRFKNVKKVYKLAECWASKWEGSDLDATSDDPAIEKLTLVFEYYLD